MAVIEMIRNPVNVCSPIFNLVYIFYIKCIIFSVFNLKSFERYIKMYDGLYVCICYKYFRANACSVQALTLTAGGALNGSTTLLRYCYWEA